ncbi:Holliday junction resolvase RecU [Bacillus solimangrovi]|uniref:Holliday junction resolvase RecU n=1 Tax=Bacillus solimangrovi TaxID=1305675 RepID=A0A1E5LIG6_9BACI|nr:Holliday junction resolvase RecU [Bacillus solimangrovi]OEH93879.1 Holliday junction resolvase RecU [Bacillus solimangrovi]
MVYRYPNGKPYRPSEGKQKRSPQYQRESFSNRGMTLEEDINETNKYYLENGIAVIHKKPTPIQIVDVHYPKRSAAVIKEAYFKQPSTTDFNGVYRGHYIDFEAKETKNKTSFPLKNIHPHQIQHLQRVKAQDGISFILIRFSLTEQIFLMNTDDLLVFWERMESGGRKSITRNEIEDCCHSISLGYHPRIDYLAVIDKIYFETRAER